MKKFAYILLAGAAVLASCNRDERNLFDKSAQERLQYAQETFYNTVVAAPYGWEMHYFPSPERAGYAFLIDFDTDKSVTIAAKNSVSTGGQYKEEVSMWDTDGTQGPVLSFKSYNSIFHNFADPGSDGLGLEGDYEFVIMETTDECIRLKGKKHGARIYMYPLTAEYSNWRKYFEAIDKFGYLTTYYNEDAEMSLNDLGTSSLITLQDGYFTRDTAGKGDLTEYGYILLPGMLRFYSGLGYTGGEARDFVLNGDMTALLYTENEGVTITPNYTPAEFVYKKLTTSNDRWVVCLDECDAATRSAWNMLKIMLRGKGAEVKTIAYECFTVDEGTEEKPSLKTYHGLYFGYYVEGRYLEGSVLLTLKQSGNKLTYTYSGYTQNLKGLLSRLGESDLDAAAKKLCAPFIGAFDVARYTSSINLTKARFQSGSKEIVVMTDGDLK